MVERGRTELPNPVGLAAMLDRDELQPQLQATRATKRTTTGCVQPVGPDWAAFENDHFESQIHCARATQM